MIVFLVFNHIIRVLYFFVFKHILVNIINLFSSLSSFPSQILFQYDPRYYQFPDPNKYNTLK